MQLVLNSLKKGLRYFCIFVVIDAALLVNVRDFLVKSPLTCPYFTDAI